MYYDAINLTNSVGSSVNYNIMKSIEGSLTPATHKKDSKMANRLYPLVKPCDCKYVIRNYPTLAAIIRVLSVDVIFNEFNFTHKDDPEFSHEQMQNFWKRNKSELMKVEEQHLGYGFGAAEILFDKETGKIPTKLHQIPSETLTIEQVSYNGRRYHFARYEYESTQKRFKIIHEDYEDFPAMLEVHGWVLWLGGGSDSEWYDLPIWSSAYHDIMTSIKKKELDHNTINNGNLPRAILLIKAPPDNSHPDEESPYESLKRQMRDSAGGVAISYLETPVNTMELKTEYVKVQDDNYEYLNQLVSATDNILLTLYHVPKIRLMIDDMKESQNSNKSHTLYEIYTLDLESYQVPIEEKIDYFNSLFWDLDINCSIKTPIFVDTKQIQVETIVNLFDVGILTLKDALLRIKALYPEHNWTNIDWENPELNQRFYHGMLFTVPGLDVGLGGLINANARGKVGYEGLYDSESDSQESIPPRSFYGR